MMKYQELDYTIDKSQTYLVVRGTNLNTGNGMSYLWWLNGSNHGTQVAPSTTKTVTVDGMQQTVIAWNMATSGIYENFSGDRPNVCMGQTIFGLTSTTGQSDIYDINFVSSVDAYIGTATGIVPQPTADRQGEKCYDLLGRSVSGTHRTGVVVKGKRLLIEN